MRWAAWVALFAMTAFAPTCEAGVELRSREYVFESLLVVHVWANVTVTAPDSSLIRDEADADDDGTVSDAERVDYEAYFVEKTNEGLTSPHLVVDRQDPQEQVARSAPTRGLAGPTASPAPIEYDLRLRVAFPAAVDVDAHRFERDVGAADKGPIKITAPPDHEMIYGAGIGDWTREDGGRTVRGRNDGSTDLDVVFAHRDVAQRISRTSTSTPADDGPDVGDETPGPHVILFILLAVLGAMWRRRR